MNQSKLKQLFDYNEDGYLVWKINASTRARLGDLAGCINPSTGYWQVVYNGKKFYNHRLIWVWNYGTEPPKYIDHVDGVRDNNKINNLRASSVSQNRHNSVKRKTGLSVYKGVTLVPSFNKWKARITIKGKQVLLGYFDSEIQAANAYNEAAIKNFKEFANLNKVSPL